MDVQNLTKLKRIRVIETRTEVRFIQFQLRKKYHLSDRARIPRNGCWSLALFDLKMMIFSDHYWLASWGQLQD